MLVTYVFLNVGRGIMSFKKNIRYPIYLKIYNNSVTIRNLQGDTAVGLVEAHRIGTDIMRFDGYVPILMEFLRL